MHVFDRSGYRSASSGSAATASANMRNGAWIDNSEIHAACGVMTRFGVEDRT